MPHTKQRVQGCLRTVGLAGHAHKARPWTIAGSRGVLPVTTDQKASCHVPLEDQYPRRGAAARHLIGVAVRSMPRS
jgi:hypothetical protein